MRTVCFIFLIAAVSLPVFSREKRDLLTAVYSKKLISEVLVKDFSWVPFPAYSNRRAWDNMSQSLQKEYVKAGEQFLKYGWPTVKATEYLEFTRTGNRMAMEIPQGERMKALQSLVMAELVEGKGRFIDDIVNGVFSFCEQSYWGLSACFYMYRERGTSLPDADDPIIDLWVGEMAADLSWIWYFFHEEFDKISPVISRRLKNELQSRVLTPFYERNDYWWITGSGSGRVNNWTPWCNYNVLTCIMLMEDDPAKKIEAVYKTMTSVDLFFNIYPNDGGCDEGPTYWGLAGGKAFDYLNLLYAATDGRVSVFDHPLVKEIGRYIYRAHVAGGIYYINFADSSPKGYPRAGVVYRYGRKINDDAMTGFGAFLLSQIKYGEEPEIGTIGPVLENLFGLNGWQLTRQAEALIPEYYFPDLQVFVARDREASTAGFYIAAKGGHNDEQHNHNDVGSCIVFFNGHPVLADAGVGTYTKDTFSEERYRIWTMQSDYHNLPLINGVAQSPGKKYAAKHSKYAAAKSKVSFSTDIAGAYPEEAKVDSWERNYTLERGKRITVSDKFQLKEVKGSTELHFMTPLQCSVLPRGIVELKSDRFVIRLKYKPDLLSAHIEKKEIDDPKLHKIWGNQLYMIVFDVQAKKSGNISIEIVSE